MTTGVPDRIALVPLASEIIARRLVSEVFSLERSIDGRLRTVAFGPEFPGDALMMYERLRAAAGQDGVVDGSYVVVDTATGTAVGQIGTFGPLDGHEVEFGYGINRSWWGRGTATTAVAQLIAQLEVRSGIGQLVADTSVDNPASGRVLEKNGFVATSRRASAEGELIRWVRRPDAGERQATCSRRTGRPLFRVPTVRVIRLQRPRVQSA